VSTEYWINRGRPSGRQPASECGHRQKQARNAHKRQTVVGLNCEQQSRHESSHRPSASETGKKAGNNKRRPAVW